MNFVFSYLLTPFFNWSYPIVGLSVVLLAAMKRFDFLPRQISRLSYKSMLWAVLGYKILYAALESAGQYYVWSVNEFTRLFLNQQGIDLGVLKEFSGKLFWLFDNRFGYFIFYSWGRFWMAVIVSLLAAWVFYLFLVFLKKYKERFFEEGETELGFLLALAVGWPNFIVFLPLAFVSVVLVSIARMAFFKEAYTTLGAPFLLAAFISVLFGGYLINAFNLAMLQI